MVEHLSYHPKVKGSNPGNDPATDSEKNIFRIGQVKVSTKNLEFQNLLKIRLDDRDHILQNFLMQILRHSLRIGKIDICVKQKI